MSLPDYWYQWWHWCISTPLSLNGLTHWGRVMHICVINLIIIASDNGLSPGRRQAFIGTNAGILLIGHLGTNFSEILIGIHTISFKKMHLKMSSAKWRPFCFGLNVLKCHFADISKWFFITKKYFWAQCQRSKFLMVQWTLYVWFRQWLSNRLVTSHYLNRWWQDFCRYMVSPGLSELTHHG